MFGVQIRSNKFVSALLSLTLAATALSLATPAHADYRPPIITTVHPTTGTITGGDQITVTGQNLQYVSGGKLGTNDIDFAHWVTRANDGTWIKFEAPDSPTTGLVDLTLYSEVNVTLPKAYTYTASKITSITPAKSTTDGGVKVSIKGEGFGPMEWTDGSLSLRIGANIASNVVRVSPTEITAIAPPGVVGNVDVSISFNNSINLHLSNNVITGSKIYSYVASSASPIITTISPKIGAPTGGNDVTISGSGLKDSVKNGVFTIGGKTATVVSVNAEGTGAVVKPAAHAVGVVDVSVTTANGTATKPGGYEYADLPAITSISPTSGVTDGGTFVTIRGANFGSSGSPVVKIGGKLALCTTLVNSTTITAVTREGAAGLADIAVTSTNGAGTATLTGGYTYAEPTSRPIIDSITPNSGTTAGGTSVDIHTSGEFPSETPTVLFGQVCAPTVTRVNNQTIRVSAPAGPAGAKNVSLTFSTVSSKSINGYTYVEPTVSDIVSVVPNNGFAVGGTAITINGHGFGNSGTPTVTIGGVAATNVVRVSNTQLTAVTPASTTIGAKPVAVTPVSQPEITKAGAFTYRAPIITSVTPNNGLAVGGTPVTIVGDGFGDTGTPAVTFGTAAATSVVRLSATTITAITPAGVLGDATVAVTPVGAAQISKPAAYTYVSSRLTPLIYNNTPQNGPQVGGVTLTLTGANFRGTTAPGVVTVGGAAVTNLVINAEGTLATFTAPALGPGVYDISITTDKGRAWRALYSVAYPPGLGTCQSTTSTQVLNPDGGTDVTIYGTNFGLNFGAPTIKLNGTVVAATEWGFTGAPDNKDYVQFTDPGGALGYVTAEITPGNNSGSISISNCLHRMVTGATIEADDKTIYFGDPTPEFTWFATGERGSDNVTGVTLTFEGNGYGPSSTAPTASGVYAIHISNGVMNPGNINDYSFSYIDGTFTILGRQADVTAQPVEKVYGDADPTFSSVVTGLEAGESHSSVTLTFTGTSTAGDTYAASTTPPTNAGTYTITPSAEVLVSGHQSSYSFTYHSATYIIHKRPVTIVSPDQTKTFGQDDPAFPWAFLDPAHTNMAYSDTLSGHLERVSGENVGTYQQTIGTMTDDNPNYEISYMDGETSRLGHLSINKKHITVTMDDKSKMYGTGDPEFTYSSSGFANGDNEFTGTPSRDPGQDAGTYSITQGTLEPSGNYVIDTFNAGTLTINTRPIQITPYARTKVYGENDPTALSGGLNSGYYISGTYGLAYTDTFSGSLSRTAGENVGDYAISQGTVALSSNYELSFVSGNKLTITKRPIRLAATDVTKVYGDSDPTPYSYTVKTGVGYYDLVSGDTISGAASRDSGEDVGDYSITKGTLAISSNYDISFDSGKLTITQYPVTVNPNDDSKIYGDDDPIFAFSTVPASLPFGDSLTGSLSRATGDGVGTYLITVGGMADSNPNYNITVGTGTFTINRLPITVTADPQSKQYGDSDPTFTYSTDVTLPYGDTLDGHLERLDTAEDLGSYEITQGTLDEGANYTITFVSDWLDINPRDLEFVADDFTVHYGDLLPDATNTLTGYIVDVNQLAFDDMIDGFGTFAYSVANPTDVGTYSITPGDLHFSSGDPNNYNITYTDGTLTIDKLPVSITADSVEKNYGDPDPTFTYTTTPETLPYGETLSGTLSRDSGSDVGTYNINVGDLNDLNTNYDVTVDSGALTINPVAITIDAIDTEKEFGATDPAFTYDITSGSLVNGDTSLGGSLGRESGEDIGDHMITIGTVASESPNYDITFVDGKLTITALSVDVTVNDVEKYYGDSDPTVTFTFDPPTLPNGDPITLAGATEREPGDALGDYAIAQGTINGGGNVTINSFTGGTLTIVPRPLHIKADDKTMTWGGSAPTNTFSLVDDTSLAFTDAISQVTYVTAGTAPRHADNYPITPSAAEFSTGVLSNYAVTYVDGELTVDPADMTITLADASSNWGDPTPTFSVKSVDGIYNGDELGELTYTADGSTTMPVNPGSYDLAATMSALASPGEIGDYNVTIIPAIYQITEPASTAIFPPSGTVDGGTDFTIYGSGFGTETPGVTFDGLPATDVVLVDTNTITGVTPEHARGPVDVVLTTTQGDFNLGKVYTYVPYTPMPTINFVFPDVVNPKGGTPVTVIGDNLCELDGTPAQVLIGTSGVTETVSDDCKTLTFKSKPGKAGRLSMLVSNGGGVATYSPGFTYLGKKGKKQISKYILFKGDSPKLSSRAKLMLRKVAKRVKKKGGIEVYVYGWIHHVKGQSLKKDKNFRKWLAERRARNVVAYLKKLGLKGKFKPQGKGIHTYGNYKDRRAELIIQYDE